MACSDSEHVIGIETSNNRFIIAQLFLFFTLSAAAVNSKTFFTSTQNDLTPLYNCIILKQTFVFCKLLSRLKTYCLWVQLLLLFVIHIHVCVPVPS